MELPHRIRTDRGAWLASDLVGDPLLVERFDDLISEARRARLRAYAPYSRFLVGAAVLMDGEVVSGCNVENASYGGTLCAERVAIAAGAARGLRDLRLIAVTTGTPAGTPLEARSPCGLCRQVIAEFAGGDALVLFDGGDDEDGALLGEAIAFERLLPLRFRLEP